MSTTAECTRRSSTTMPLSPLHDGGACEDTGWSANDSGHLADALEEMMGDATDESPILLRGADALFSWYFEHAVDSSVFARSDVSRQLHQDGHLPDRQINVETSAHHLAEALPSAPSGSCCIVKGTEGHGFSRCRDIDTREQECMLFFSVLFFWAHERSS
eukprot:2244704-Pyramimonas_sp.AAC.3